MDFRSSWPPPPNQDRVRRRWIWQALSDLFLDEETTEDTILYIARIAAECEYSDAELDAIYRREVAPAVAFNMFCVAGAWGYFDTIWLENRILQRHEPVYWIDHYVLAPLAMFVIRKIWIRIKLELELQRQRVEQEKARLGDQWQPCWAQEGNCYRWTE